MEVNENCTVFNMKLDVANHLNYKTVCKTCYDKIEKKHY